VFALSRDTMYWIVKQSEFQRNRVSQTCYGRGASVRMEEVGNNKKSKSKHVCDVQFNRSESEPALLGRCVVMTRRPLCTKCSSVNYL
jgi:hypothetical protein